MDVRKIEIVRFSLRLKWIRMNGRSCSPVHKQISINGMFRLCPCGCELKSLRISIKVIRINVPSPKGH